MTTPGQAVNTLQTSERDRGFKHNRILRILEGRNAENIVLSSAAAVNWYLGGSRTHVSLAAGPIVQLEIGPGCERVHITKNEVERFRLEELPKGFEVVERDWWEEPPTSELTEFDVAAELRAARADLLPGERQRFGVLCRDAADIVTDVMQRIRPTMTEFDIAGELSRALIRRKIEPLVLLVGGASRSHLRHPLPTAARAGDKVMVVVCARRWGLIANLTRWVRFRPASPFERDAESRIMEVEADAFAATRKGAQLRSALSEIAKSYVRHGFDAEEWRRHHQGGVAGYDGRDPRATPDAADRFSTRSFVAWNPSGNGAKIEDTVMVEHGLVTPLTVDENWPTTLVRGVHRPVTLEL